MYWMKPEDWQMHIDAINNWHNDAFQEDIIWHKNIVNRNYHGEDYGYNYDDITLKGLVNYNFFRTWPIDQMTDTGEIDKQSCVLMMNLKYLESRGFLNENQQFDFNPGDDKFTINGVLHVASGDSHISQAFNDPLMCFIILKREEIETGNTRY